MKENKLKVVFVDKPEEQSVLLKSGLSFNTELSFAKGGFLFKIFKSNCDKYRNRFKIVRRFGDDVLK